VLVASARNDLSPGRPGEDNALRNIEGDQR
jgi:hypothetical protein